MEEEKALDELLEWLKLTGQFLVIDDYADIFKMNRIHHWQIGTFLVLFSKGVEILKGVKDVADELREE